MSDAIKVRTLTLSRIASRGQRPTEYLHRSSTPAMDVRGEYSIKPGEWEQGFEERSAGVPQW